MVSDNNTGWMPTISAAMTATPMNVMVVLKWRSHKSISLMSGSIPSSSHFSRSRIQSLWQFSYHKKVGARCFDDLEESGVFIVWKNGKQMDWRQDEGEYSRKYTKPRVATLPTKIPASSN